MLNKTRVGNFDVVESLLNSRFAVQKEISYPIDALHLFAENAPADARNKCMINPLNTECIFIKAIYEIPINLVF